MNFEEDEEDEEDEEEIQWVKCENIIFQLIVYQFVVDFFYSIFRRLKRFKVECFKVNISLTENFNVYIDSFRHIRFFVSFECDKHDSCYFRLWFFYKFMVFCSCGKKN